MTTRSLRTLENFIKISPAVGGVQPTRVLRSLRSLRTLDTCFSSALGAKNISRRFEVIESPITQKWGDSKFETPITQKWGGIWSPQPPSILS